MEGKDTHLDIPSVAPIKFKNGVSVRYYLGAANQHNTTTGPVKAPVSGGVMCLHVSCGITNNTPDKCPVYESSHSTVLNGHVDGSHLVCQRDRHGPIGSEKCYVLKINTNV